MKNREESEPMQSDIMVAKTKESHSFRMKQCEGYNIVLCVCIMYVYGFVRIAVLHKLIMFRNAIARDVRVHLTKNDASKAHIMRLLYEYRGEEKRMVVSDHDISGDKSRCYTKASHLVNADMRVNARLNSTEIKMGR